MKRTRIILGGVLFDPVYPGLPYRGVFIFLIIPIGRRKIILGSVLFDPVYPGLPYRRGVYLY